MKVAHTNQQSTLFKLLLLCGLSIELILCFTYATQMHAYAFTPALRYDYVSPPSVQLKLPGTKAIFALNKPYTTDDSLWALVNKQQAISKKYIPAQLVSPDVPLRSVQGPDERTVRQELKVPIEAMFAQAKADGHNFMLGSAYRSAVLQQEYLDDYVSRLGEAGRTYSAEPGQSEHQTGLAIDVSNVSQGCIYSSDCSVDAAGRVWLAKNAHLFGFHLRYMNGKESITGYSFEPWHFRYVGVPFATALYESKLTLEEAWPFMQTAHEKIIKRQSDAIAEANKGY